MLLNQKTNFQNNFLIKILMRINKNKILIFVISFQLIAYQQIHSLLPKFFKIFFVKCSFFKKCVNKLQSS